jgi:K+-transporting ATPase A subunit
MQTSKIVDRFLRVVAFIHAPMGAVLGLPLLMLGAIMAPTFGSGLQSVLVIAMLVALVAWVMIGCVKPDTIAQRLLRGPRLRFLLIRVPIYLFALAGISWWASYSYIHLKTEHSNF